MAQPAARKKPGGEVEVEFREWLNASQHVSFKSEAHALPFLNGTPLDDLPIGSVVRLAPVYPPDGQIADSFSVGSTAALTSQSEAHAVAVAEAVRNNPPDAMKRQLVGQATPIFVIDSVTSSVRRISGVGPIVRLVNSSST